MLESQETQAQSPAKTPWRRAQQPIPVFLPGESHGEKSLVGYSPWVAMSLTLLKLLSMHTCILSSRAEEQLWSHCCCWVRYSQTTPSWAVGWSGIRVSSFGLTCGFPLRVKGTSQAGMDGTIRARIATLAPSVEWAGVRDGLEARQASCGQVEFYHVWPKVISTHLTQPKEGTCHL